MKKIMIITVSLVAALCACQKQEIAPADDNCSAEKQIITAYVNADTKVAYDSSLSSVWEEGDTFLAIQDGSKTVTFTLQSGAGSKGGVFTAETSGATESTKWVAVVGAKAAAVSSEIHCNYMNQKGTLAGLKDFAYAKAEATGLEPTFNFNGEKNLTYVLRLKLPAGIKAIEYTPSGWKKVAGDAVEDILYNSKDENDFSSKNTSTIVLDQATAEGDVVYLAVPALDFSAKREIITAKHQYQNDKTALVLTIMNDVSDNATQSTGYVFNENVSEAGGKSVTVDFTGAKLLRRPRPSDAVTFTSSDVVSEAHSSVTQYAKTLTTYWAPYNIGARMPSDAGNYYMFGMHVPYQGGEDSFVEYAYRGQTPEGKEQLYNRLGVILPKYSTSDSRTFYSIANSRYDTARILWGCAWRLPHIMELTPFYDNAKAKTSVVTESVAGQNCLKFTNAATGNTLYFPIAGVYKNASHNDADYAVVMSADKVNRSAKDAGWNAEYTMYANSDLSDVAIDRYELKNAIPVRPVLATSIIEPKD